MMSILLRLVTPLILALQLLTRIPLPFTVDASKEQIGRSILFYPLVGLIIGGMLWGVATTATPSSLLLTAALITALWVLITGALHMDALADTTDAWVGGLGDRQRTLDIMKDSFIGPMGVSAIVMLLLLKFAALYTLLQQGELIVLLLIPMMGRAQILLLFLTTPYVREQGMGSALASHLPRFIAWTMLLISILGWGYLMQQRGIILLAILLLFFLLFRWSLMKRIGGTTGDTAGALIELSELLLLIAVAVGEPI